MFQGLKEDTYQFFWEIAFNNEQSFYEANKDRYKKNVYEPLKELAVQITPAAHEIDKDFNVRPAAVISRIRRDTRYTHDKTMFRDQRHRQSFEPPLHVGAPAAAHDKNIDVFQPSEL